MAQLDPWDEGYEDNTQALDPWEEGYDTQSAPQESIPVEDVRGAGGIPGGVVVQPKVKMPDTAMYENLPDKGNAEANFRQARDLYESYQDQPEAGRTFTGELTYKNTVVPYPEPLADGAVDAGFGQTAATTGRGIVKNTAVTGAAMLDEINYNLFGYRSDLARKAEELIANPTPAGNVADSIIIETGEAGAGMIAGLKFGQSASRTQSRSGRDGTGPRGTFGNQMNPTYDPNNIRPQEQLTTMARVLSGVGSTLGGTLTMNEDTDPLVVGTLLQGVPVDENGHYSEQVLNKKLNLLYDQMTAAFGAQKAGQAAEWAFKAVKGITYDQIKPMFSEGTRESEAIDAVVDALNSNTPEGRAQLAKVIEENKEIWVNMPDPDIDGVNLKRTTMSAINEGLSETDKWKAQRAMELEAGVFHSGNTDLQRRLDQPMEAFKTMQDQAVDSRGGAQTIEAARQHVVDSAIKDVEGFRAKPVAQQGVIDQSIEDTRNLLRNDPLVGPDITRMEGSPELNTGAYRSDAEDRVMKDIRNTADAMTKQKNDLYAAIPEDAPIDREALIEVLNKNMDYVPQSVLARVTNPKNEITFRQVYDDIMPQISKAMSSKLNAKKVDEDAIGALREIQDHVNRVQTEYVATHGSPDAKAAADKARGYFRDDYSPFAKTSTTESLFDHRPKTEYDKIDDAQQVVNSLSDKRKGGTQATLDLLRRPENVGNKDDIAKVYMGDAVKRLARKAGSEGGIDTISPDDIISELEDVGTTFKKEFPDQAKQMETLAGRLRTAKGNTKMQKEIFKQVEEEARASEQKVFSSVLGKFLEKDPLGNMRSKGENGYETVKRLLNQENNHNQISDLVERVNASGDPLVEKGLESAYFSYLRDRIQDASQGFSPRQAERFVDPQEIKSLKEYGKIIFKDPKIVDAMDEVVGALLNERDKKSPAGMALATKGLLGKAAAAAINFSTNMSFGVLNPTSTKIKNIAGAVLRKSNGDEAGMRIMERIHADPDYAIRLLNDLGKLKEKDKFTKVGKDLMWKVLTYNTLYDDERKDDFEKDWNDYVQRNKTSEDMKKLK